MKSEASLSDEWETPDWLFRARDERFRFQFDAAATVANTKCERFYSKRNSALRQKWRGRGWMNCPYSRGHLLDFVGHARRQVLTGHAELVDCLVPAYTCERWWHEYVEADAGERVGVERLQDYLGAGYRRRYRELTVEVFFLRRRLRFLYRGSAHGGTSARFSSALVTFLAPEARL